MSEASNPSQHSDQPVDPVDQPGVSDATEPAASSTVLPPGERRRRTIELLIACAVLAIGLFIALQGVMKGVTGDDRANFPPAIEAVSPIPDAVQAFSGDSVQVDLKAGYTGTLTIDGVAIKTVNLGDYVPADVQSGQQINLPPDTIYEPGNATLTFTPSSSAAIQEFSTGKHTVLVSYWQIIDGPQKALSYLWTFNVT